MIRIKRVYEPPERWDGVRLLVERLWPRGMKTDLRMDAWLKDAAPSTPLRRWVRARSGSVAAVSPPLLRRVGPPRRGVEAHLPGRAFAATLPCSTAARDEKHNNALALKDSFKEAVMVSDSRQRPTVLVIFGGRGDLAWRELVPALFSLHADKKLARTVCRPGRGPRQTSSNCDSRSASRRR